MLEYHTKNIIIIVLAVGIPLILAAIAGFVVLICYMRRKNAKLITPNRNEF